jgi:glutamine amidotransferase
MGWNTIAINQDAHGLLKNIPSQSYFYYVHSFGVKVGEHTLASTHYGPHFSAVVAKDNFYGVQFHPERSGAMGAQVLQNFLEL